MRMIEHPHSPEKPLSSPARSSSHGDQARHRLRSASANRCGSKGRSGSIRTGRSEAIVPFTIELDSPQVFVGDGICDTGARRSLDLWLGDPQAFSTHIDQRVTVTGVIDCPRGRACGDQSARTDSCAPRRAERTGRPAAAAATPCGIDTEPAGTGIRRSPGATRSPGARHPGAGNAGPPAFVPPSQLPIEVRCRQYLDWLIRGRELRALPNDRDLA